MSNINLNSATIARVNAVVEADARLSGAYAVLVHNEKITLDTVAEWVQILADAAMAHDDAVGRVAQRLMKCEVATIDDTVPATFTDALDALTGDEYEADDVKKATAYVRKAYATKFRNGLNYTLRDGDVDEKKGTNNAGALITKKGANASLEDVIKAWHEAQK